MSIPALPQDENALAPPDSAYVFDWPAIQGRADSRLEVRYFFGDYRYVAFLIDFNDFWFNGRYQYFKFDGVSLDRNDLAELCGQDEADKLRREPGRKLKAYVPSQSTWVALRSLRETHHKQQQANVQLSRHSSAPDSDPPRMKKVKQQAEPEEAYVEEKFPVGYSACRELTVPKEWAREQFKSSEFPVQLKLQVRLNGVMLPEQYDVKVSRDNRNDRASRRYRIALTSGLRELGEIVQASKFISEWQRASPGLVIIAVINSSSVAPPCKATSATNAVKDDSEQDMDQVMDDEAAAVALAAEELRTGPSTRARAQKGLTGVQAQGISHCSVDPAEPVPGVRESLQGMWFEQQRLLEQHAAEVAAVEEKQKKMTLEHEAKLNSLQQEHHAQLAKLQAKQQADVQKAVQRQYSDTANQRSGVIIDQYRCELHAMHEKHGNQLGKLAGKQEQELQSLLEKQHQEARKLDDRRTRLWGEHQDALRAALQRYQDSVCAKVNRHMQRLRDQWQQQQEAEEEDAAATLASLAGGVPRRAAAAAAAVAGAMEAQPAQVEAPQNSANCDGQQDTGDDKKQQEEDTSDDTKMEPEDSAHEPSSKLERGREGEGPTAGLSSFDQLPGVLHGERCCSSPSLMAQSSGQGDLPTDPLFQEPNRSSGPTISTKNRQTASADASTKASQQSGSCISSPRRDRKPSITTQLLVPPLHNPPVGSSRLNPHTSGALMDALSRMHTTTMTCDPTHHIDASPATSAPPTHPQPATSSSLHFNSLHDHTRMPPLPQATPSIHPPPATLCMPTSNGYSLHPFVHALLAPRNHAPSSVSPPTSIPPLSSQPSSTSSKLPPARPLPTAAYLPPHPATSQAEPSSSHPRLFFPPPANPPANPPSTSSRPSSAEHTTARCSPYPSVDTFNNTSSNIDLPTTTASLIPKRRSPQEPLSAEPTTTASTNTTFIPYNAYSNTSVTCIPAPKEPHTTLPTIPPLKYFAHREPELLERLASTPCLSCTEPQTSGAESGSRSLPSSPAAWESAAHCSEGMGQDHIQSVGTKRTWSEADGTDLNAENVQPPVKRPPKLMMKMIHV